jgi:phytoene synthase
MAEIDPGDIARMLREGDPDRYFGTLVLPAGVRAAAQALYAFCAEVAAISTRVRDANAGEIRLQWWRDALSGAGHGDVVRNPIAAALLTALGRYRLPVAPMLRLLEARTFDLYADPMPDLPAFEGYAGDTAAVPYQLVAMMLNGGAVVEPGDAAGHLGVAHALIGHMRAFGYNARRGRIFLPWSVFAGHGVTRDEVLTGQVTAGLRGALHQFRDLGAEHLDKAASALQDLPKPLRPAFATIAVLRGDLRGMRRQAGDPFALVRRPVDWRRLAALAWWTWRNG